MVRKNLAAFKDICLYYNKKLSFFCSIIDSLIVNCLVPIHTQLWIGGIGKAKLWLVRPNTWVMRNLHMNIFAKFPISELANSVPRIGRRSFIKSPQSRLKFFENLSPYHSFNGGISRFFDAGTPSYHSFRGPTFDSSFNEGNEEYYDSALMMKRDKV